MSGGTDDPLMREYHDREWGVPLYGDRELLTLEGAQAGLSWRTILARREGYRTAFEGFDLERIAAFTEADRERLRGDERIIRNREKIAATVANARAALVLRDDGISLDALPTDTERSKAMSKGLRRRGFSFVGPTVCYAFMQAAGMVNDHVTSCFRYAEVTAETRGETRE